MISTPRSYLLAALGAAILLLALLVPAVPAHAAPVRYEAENAAISQGVVESNHAGFTGTGFVNYDNVTGSYVEWTADAPQAGPYSLALRFANGTTTNRPMTISVNGTTAAANVAFPGTGAWTTWQTVTVSASLTAGANTIRATATTANGGPNTDSLTVDTANANVITVSSIAQLQSAAANASPGTRIELTDGVYTTSGTISLSRSGTAAAPITIAAQHVGGAEIRGSAGFAFTSSAAYVTVSGFRFTHSGGITIPAASHHIRFSRNVVQLPGSVTNWLTVVGDDCEVDHNTFQNRSSQGVFLQVTGPGSAGMAQRTHVHHNYFFNHTFAGANGGESVRLGLSARQATSAHAVIEYNLFERANGDPEAISVKSSDNLVRYNTIRDSKGSIVLRHGNRTRVEGNLMLGNTAGIRLYENDHVIVNNVIQGGTGQIIVGSGTIVDDTNSTAHARADRALIAFNTISGTGTNLISVGPGGDQFGPDDCTMADNIIVGGGSGALVDVGRGTNLHWQGNIVWAGTGGDMPASGFRLVNPGLVTDAGGLRRLPAASPAIDTAAGSFPQVTQDLDLQNRTGAKDVGADEYSPDGTQRRPLTTGDVGPNAA